MYFLRTGKERSAEVPLHRKNSSLFPQGTSHLTLTLKSAVIGSVASGWLADKIGRKLTFFIGFMFSIVGITLEVVATSSPVFFTGKFVNGFAIGAFISVSFTYVGEVSNSIQLISHPS